MSQFTTSHTDSAHCMTSLHNVIATNYKAALYQTTFIMKSRPINLFLSFHICFPKSW